MIAFALAYTPLVKDFPLQTQAAGDIGAYINNIITFAIGLAGILAVVMIIVGGLQYVSTDAWSSKSDGKNKIMAALGGLILALASFLILNTIDPTLTNLNFKIDQQSIDNLRKGLSTSGGQFSIDNATPIGPTLSGAPLPGPGTPGSNVLQNTAEGYFVDPTYIALDNDGRNPPPFPDPDSPKGPGYQPRTSHTINGQYLDANTDFFVVVPIDSPIKNGTKVRVYNRTTNKEVMAIVGDRGPAYGEISRAAAKEIGAWKEGMGNSISQHDITFTFYK